MKPIDSELLVQKVKADIDRCYMMRIGAVGPLVRFLEQIEECPVLDVRENVYTSWVNGDGIYDTCKACGSEIYQAMVFKYCPECGAKFKED